MQVIGVALKGIIFASEMVHFFHNMPIVRYAAAYFMGKKVGRQNNSDSLLFFYKSCFIFAFLKIRGKNYVDH